MRNYHVCGVGAALVDTEIAVSDRELASFGIDKGLMTLVDEARHQQLLTLLQNHLTVSRKASGGSAANTVIAVSNFGGRAFYSCKVADDDNGHFYLADLAAAGVGYRVNGNLPEGTTGKCLVLITPDAERTMNTFLGISETLAEDDLAPPSIADAEYLYIEGYLVTSETGRRAAIAAREIAEAHGTKTALSLSDPGMVAHFRAGLEDMVGNGVDLLFCNREEALGWSNTRSLDMAVEKMSAFATQFAITLGADGALIYDGSELHTIPPYIVTTVDSNGAGDMFAGALLYGITHGFDFPSAGKLASVAAATVVSQYGPRLHPEQHRGILETFRHRQDLVGTP